MNRRVVGDARADRIPGAGVDQEIILEGGDAAIGVEAHFDLVHLIARMAGAEKMLAPILDPLHRPPERAGKERN